MVEAARFRRRPISCMECPCALRSAISSRSANERYRPDSGFVEDLNIAGDMPPAFRNNLLPIASDTPAFRAAASMLKPVAIPCQNSSCSARPATDGRPKEPRGARVDRFLRIVIATLQIQECCDDRLSPRVVPAVPVVPAPCIFFARGPRASAEARPSLRPLLERADEFAKLGRGWRRENNDCCCAVRRRFMDPRSRGAYECALSPCGRGLHI